MRLEIQVDSINHQIDSTNPDLLSQWIMEIFTRTMPWAPATYVTARAYPSYIPNLKNLNQPWLDWIADTRYMETIFGCKTPRELVNALSESLDKYEKKDDDN